MGVPMRVSGWVLLGWVLLGWVTPLAAAADCLEVLEADYEKGAPDNGYAEVVWVATVENRCAASHDAYLDFQLIGEAGKLLAKDLAAEVVPPGRKEIAGSLHLAERDLPAAASAKVAVSGRERPR